MPTAGLAVAAVGAAHPSRARAGQVVQLAQIGFQFAKLGGVEAVIDPAAILAGGDEARFTQGFEVKGEFGLGDVQAIAQIAHAHLLRSQQLNHLQPQRVRKGLKLGNGGG